MCGRQWETETDDEQFPRDMLLVSEAGRERKDEETISEAARQREK